MVPEIWCVADVIVISHFGLGFALLPPHPPPPPASPPPSPNSPKNQNLKKIKKNPGVSSFYRCVPKVMIR